MDQKPKIPTLKDTQKPQVRIKGLAARLSLVERLKQFKKKDLAFILAGLGVLFMAPLAEHFMMSPENADTGAFKPGWGFQAKGFGDGTSPYDPGVNGMAPGSQLGGGGDVITPLNVRDPSALVMGPGSSQQAAATSTTPPPPAKENTDWKDAIANAATRGAATATKAASLPVPKTSLTNAGLRGLGVAGGNSGASWNAPPISASNVPNRSGGGSNMAGVNKAPGYMGVGSRGPKNADGGSLEDLKKMAERAGSVSNRLGSAGTNLETAAGLGKGEGAGMGGDGAGRGGKEDKGGGGNSGKDSKSLGESLAFLAAKAHQQHAIDLYWKLKEKDAMLWPNLKEKILETTVMDGLIKPLSSGVAKAFEGFGSDVPGNAYWQCTAASGATAQVPIATTPGCKPGKQETEWCCKGSGMNATCMRLLSAGTPTEYTCEKKSGDSTKPGKTDPAVDQVPGTGAISGKGEKTGLNLDGICREASKTTATDGKQITFSAGANQIRTGIVSAVQNINGAASMLDTSRPASSCGMPTGASGLTDSSLSNLRAIQDKLLGEKVFTRIQGVEIKAYSAMGIALKGDNKDPKTLKDGEKSARGLTNATKDVTDALAGIKDDAGKTAVVASAKKAYDDTLEIADASVVKTADDADWKALQADLTKVQGLLQRVNQINGDAKKLLDNAQTNLNEVTTGLGVFKGEPNVTEAMVKDKQGWLSDVQSKLDIYLKGSGISGGGSNVSPLKQYQEEAASVQEALTRAQRCYTATVPELLTKASNLIDKPKAQAKDAAVGGMAQEVAVIVSDEKMPTKFSEDPKKFAEEVAGAKTEVEKLPAAVSQKLETAIADKDAETLVNKMPEGYLYRMPITNGYRICKAVALGSEGDSQCK